MSVSRSEIRSHTRTHARTHTHSVSCVVTVWAAQSRSDTCWSEQRATPGTINQLINITTYTLIFSFVRLYVADPATCPAPNTVLGSSSPLRAACLFTTGENKYIWLSVITSLILQISKFRASICPPKTTWCFCNSRWQQVRILVYVFQCVLCCTLPSLTKCI